MKIKIKLLEGGKMPTKGSKGAAAFDCYARCDCAVTNNATIIPLGFALELPEGYHAEIAPRSSTGLKTAIRCANSFGVIDSDYRGEVGFIVEAKHGAYAWVAKGERVCQMLIKRNEDVDLVQVDELSDTERGSGGYGSTGV